MATPPIRSREPAIRDHQEWLGYLQPNGLVVSPQVLFDQQVIIDRSTAIHLQREFLGALAAPTTSDAPPRFGAFLQPGLDDRAEGFALRFLGWHTDLIDGCKIADPHHPEGPDLDRPLLPSVTIAIPELEATLRPTAALRHSNPEQPAQPYQLLVDEIGADEDFDTACAVSRLWHTSPSNRFERLLSESGVPLGILSNGSRIRLFYAPRGETTGHITFDCAHLTEPAGRLIVAGMHLLLNARQLTNVPKKQRLTELCEVSRKYQSTVSAALSEQVLESLYELVRGFQSANDSTHGDLLRPLLTTSEENRQSVYRGLLRTLMRLVFILFAEDRDLLSSSGLYSTNYSVHSLLERLRADNGRFQDTMDSRYGAWAQLLAVFRLIHTGSPHPQLRLPPRHGYLFDPEAFPFLEGNTLAEPQIPLVSDGCVLRVLENLLILKGERLSYRTLDVEQIGSVYETMMGFKMELAAGSSIAIKSKKKGGAPIAIDLDEVRNANPADRQKLLEGKSDANLSPKQASALELASTNNEIIAAIETRIAHAATPRPVPAGAMLLQPSDERRRSGSHYTPRSLTQPIVAKTLEPILARLGPDARPDQILDLKICDPAMGSGAFLVEVCRQLGKRLEDAWTRTGTAPRVTAQDDLLTLSRRLVAQRCVYGVDRNDMAVDLAKLSLWLATLAKDHPFTFLDHALRHGDSLVGLDLAQLDAFHWDASQPKSFVSVKINEKLHDAIKIREEIRRADDSVFREEQLKTLLAQSEAATAALKMAGDLVIAAFFSEEKDKARLDRLAECAVLAQAALGTADAPAMERAKQHAAATIAKHELVPFHWAIAFPEVFMRANPGFDGFVGNPPFLGGRNLTASAGERYAAFLVATIPEATAAADLVARFFRAAFSRLRNGGTLGLIATNTIAQGDSRSSGLRWICTHDGEIYAVRKRIKWPGEAAVVVSVVYIMKGRFTAQRLLDGRPVDAITAFLFHAGGHDDPAQLAANASKSFQGSIVLGMGFTFDDTDKKGVASSLAEMRRLIAKNPDNQQAIFPYIGGEEVNTSPTHAPHRYVINFGERSEAECRERWPDLMAIVEERVKPERIRSSSTSKSSHGERSAIWWQHYHKAQELYAAITGMERVLVTNCGASAHASFTLIPARQVFANSLVVFPLSSNAAFTTLQSRPHELWTRFFASSLEDRLRYTPSDCFETFPFPEDFETNDDLERAGRAYYDFRGALMLKANLGLTKTYNRFHDRDNREPDIVRLRELHAAMDRAVLDAYGWNDIKTDCDFFPDYTEEDEDGNEVEKSIRYRWPDEVRDEVLARLLDLNAKYHEEDIRSSLADAAGTPTTTPVGRTKKARRANAVHAVSTDEPSLYAEGEE